MAGAVGILGNTSLFRGVPGDELAQLSRAAKPRIFPKDAFLFREGDPGAAIFVLVSGEVKIGRTGHRGDEVVFGVINPGETFGELALLEEEPMRSADAQALEKSECLAIGKDVLMPFLEKHPEVIRRLIQMLLEYLRATDATITEAAFLDIPGRLARKLLELGGSQGARSDGGVRLPIRLSQRTLAGMIGASRENVNRALSRFERQGLLRKEGGYITLLQRERLERLC